MQNRTAVFLLLLANSISGVAQGISMLAIPWYFTGIIHQEKLFAQAYFVITCASLFWGLYAGTLVDRFDRKKIFLATNISGFCVLSGVAAWGWYNGNLPWLLVATVFCTTVFVYSIHFPNLYAFAQEITPKEHYSRITSLIEIQGQITFTVAGGLAAIMLSGWDGKLPLFTRTIHFPVVINKWQVHEIFALDAFTYLLSFIIIYAIKTFATGSRHVDKGSIHERIKTGFSFLKVNRAVFHFGNASLLVFLTILVWGTYVQPVFVSDFLHRNAQTYALGDMAFSAGALLAGFITTRIFSERHAVKGVIVLSAVTGFMYAITSANKTVWVFFAANFLIGACNAAVRIQRITFLFHHIPNSIIGRAGSVFFVINVLLRLLLIGIFSLPFFHESGNITYAVVILSIICFAGAGILSLQLVNKRW